MARPAADRPAPVPPSSASPWAFDGAVAAFPGGFRLDLAAPSTGLVTPSGDRLLGLAFGADPAPGDHWARGDDVTATWETADDRHLRATALWRWHPSLLGAGPAPGVTAWELIASATTRRLHADSTVAVICDLQQGEVLSAPWRGDAIRFGSRTDARDGIVLVRRGASRGDDGTSVLVMLHPDDHQEVSIDHHGDRTRIRCWLFPTGVEKGVLLRSRVAAAVGPAVDDLGWATRLAEAFAASPPILST